MADVNGTAEVDVHVLEVKPQSSRLRWESGNSVVNAAALQLGPAYRDALEDFGDFRFAVDYSTDEWGGFDRVENLDDLRSQAEAMVAKLAGVLGDSPEVVQAIDLAKQLILSDTFLQTALVEDTMSFHVAYGLVIPPHDTVTVDQDFPNPYGGPPIPGTVTSKLVSARDPDGCVVVEFVSVPDGDAFTRALAEMFSQTAGSRFTLPEDLGTFEVRNTMRLTYDPGSGWVVRADLEKTIHLGSTTRSYHTLIEAT